MSVVLRPSGFKAGAALVVAAVPGSRGTVGGVLAYQRLPSEPIGSIYLTLTGIKNGSEVHIFNASGDAIADSESTSGDVVFQMNVYSAGNANNTVRIFVASLGYENIDIRYTLPTQNVSVPFFQRIDRTYKNPT